MKTNSSIAVKTTPLQEKIVGMLKAGIPDATVAMATGASPGYVSGIRETYREEIIAATAGRIERAVKLDDSYNRVEEGLIGKLEEALNSGMIYKTRDLLEGIKIVNGAARKAPSAGPSAESGRSTENGRVIIEIQLPESARVKYVKDSKNRVIEVNGRPLATAAPSALTAISYSQDSVLQELNNMAIPEQSEVAPSAARVHSAKVKFKL